LFLGYENFLTFLGAMIFWIVMSAIICAPFYYITKFIQKKIRRRKLKGFTETPPDDIENWNPEPDPIDVDPPEENPEDDRLNK
jgi:hypothetical protein